MGQTGLIKQITSNKQSIFGLFIVAVTVFATFYSAVASAETLSERSITPSTASKNAEAGSVSYEVTFTPEEDAGAIVLDFCSNTPVLGQSCTAPAGMNLAGATIVSGATVTNASANKLVLTATLTDGAAKTIQIDDLTNPSTALTNGIVYVRMVTFATGTEATNYTSANPTNTGASTILDSGSVSMFFNTDVTVQGTVLETMTFCVSGADITPNCGNATTPVLSLGQGTPKALEPGTVSTGILYTQMNTNASGGAVVRLKSSATCGGLMRIGTTECNIAAAGATNVIDSDNSAKFGVKLASATTATGAVNPIGTLVPYDADGAEVTLSAFYDTANYKFNFVDGTTGVTSVFGDPLLSTDGGPATNQNMALTFGASIGTDTPAGTYSTDLNLIAVGTF